MEDAGTNEVEINVEVDCAVEVDCTDGVELIDDEETVEAVEILLEASDKRTGDVEATDLDNVDDSVDNTEECREWPLDEDDDFGGSECEVCSFFVFVFMVEPCLFVTVDVLWGVAREAAFVEWDRLIPVDGLADETVFKLARFVDLDLDVALGAAVDLIEELQLES